MAFLSKDERKYDERNEALLNLLVKYRLHVLSTENTYTHHTCQKWGGRRVGVVRYHWLAALDSCH